MKKPIITILFAALLGAIGCSRLSSLQQPVDRGRHRLAVHTTRRVEVRGVRAYNTQTLEESAFRKETEGDYRPQGQPIGIPRQLHVVYPFRSGGSCADYAMPALEVDGVNWGTRSVHVSYSGQAMECVYMAYPAPADI